MDHFSEEEVKLALEPYHGQIFSIVDRAFSEWLAVSECRSDKGFAPLLYSRTIANYIFDAIAREGIAEFGGNDKVRIIEDTQTVKFCFDGVVLARFKKANEDGIGQNIPTQAALDFADPQETLPGIPPEAAKVEVVWVADELMTGIERVTILARDHESIIWSYDIDSEESGSEIVPFPPSTPPDDDLPLVAVRPQADTRSESE